MCGNWANSTSACLPVCQLARSLATYAEDVSEPKGCSSVRGCPSGGKAMQYKDHHVTTTGRGKREHVRKKEKGIKGGLRFARVAPLPPTKTAMLVSWGNYFIHIMHYHLFSLPWNNAATSGAAT